MTDWYAINDRVPTESDFKPSGLILVESTPSKLGSWIMVWDWGEYLRFKNIAFWQRIIVRDEKALSTFDRCDTD